MNIIYSSDNNYARHAGIAITSLYDHNRDVRECNVFLIDDGISEENHAKLDRVAERFSRKITYIPFAPFKKLLTLNNKWELPISAYARLFIADMVPESVDKILYLDCDTIIQDSLEDLWTLDMQGKTIASVEDICSTVFGPETGVAQPYHYFCSGVILIDLKRWREIDAQKKLLDYLDSRSGQVRHHDQTILNGVFWNDCLMLHPKYDVVTPQFLMSYTNLKAYFKLWDQYYTKQEFQEAVKHPAIIHYTSSNAGRPWENNAHPKAGIYQKYWRESEWKDAPWGQFKGINDAVTKRTFWLYQHFPAWMINFVTKIRGH